MDSTSRNFSIFLPSDVFLVQQKGPSKWSSKKPPHGCSYHDRSTSILNSWKDIITIIRLCGCPPNVHPSCCRKKCERSSDYITFLHLSIDLLLWWLGNCCSAANILFIKMSSNSIHLSTNPDTDSSVWSFLLHLFSF